jgi:hypothetical protein
MLPFVRKMSDSGYMLLAQLISFLPPIAAYFYFTKKDVRKTLRLNPLGWKNALIIFSFGVSIQPLMDLPPRVAYVTAILKCSCCMPMPWASRQRK